MSFRMNLQSIVCLNVKELLVRSRRYIWSLSDSNVIRTHNHLVRKQKLNNLPKLADGWVFVHELSGYEFESRCCHLKICMFAVNRRTLLKCTDPRPFFAIDLFVFVSRCCMWWRYFRLLVNDLGVFWFG